LLCDSVTWLLSWQHGWFGESLSRSSPDKRRSPSLKGLGSGPARSAHIIRRGRPCPAFYRKETGRRARIRKVQRVNVRFKPGPDRRRIEVRGRGDRAWLRPSVYSELHVKSHLGVGVADSIYLNTDSQLVINRWGSALARRSMPHRTTPAPDKGREGVSR
jgi:hypothetical protein